MKGTEKQIAWAEDIIKSARGTVAANVKLNNERAEEHAKIEGSKAYQYYREEAEKWTRLGEQLEKIFSMTDDAVKIIEERHLFDPSALCKKWVNRA